MTTPTQAQIEAAAKAINHAWRSEAIPHTPNWEMLAKAAITAAAQVGDRKDETINNLRESELVRIRYANRLEAATIERCAQVVADYDPDDSAVSGRGVLAAAIRKLTDEAITVALTDIEEAKAIIEKTDQTVNRLNFLATIERCAQVAEQNYSAGFAVHKEAGTAIAAAIRKLKDEDITIGWGGCKVDPNIVHPGKDLDFTFPEEEP